VAVVGILARCTKISIRVWLRNVPTMVRVGTRVESDAKQSAYVNSSEVLFLRKLANLKGITRDDQASFMLWIQ
jgi:hypothetical protein